jgi:hypothetical protein
MWLAVVFIFIGQYLLACVLLPDELLNVSAKSAWVSVSFPVINNGNHIIGMWLPFQRQEIYCRLINSMLVVQ